VWLDNVRTHQIGGETDGISAEVAEDLGFRPPEQISFNQKNEIGASAIKKSGIGKPKQKLSGSPAAQAARKQRANKREKINERIARNTGPWGSDLGNR
ncbi:MAG: hypothetical protein ACR2KZ_05010, partial [Segetibacter sp.]